MNVLGIDNTLHDLQYFKMSLINSKREIHKLISRLIIVFNCWFCASFAIQKFMNILANDNILDDVHGDIRDRFHAVN